MRQHITVVNFYSILPLRHGGCLGTFGFYKALAEWVDVTIICMTTDDMARDEIKLSESLTIINLLLPEYFHSIQEKLGFRDNNLIVPIMREIGNYKKIVDRAKEISKKSAAIVVDHVYAFRLAKAMCSGKALFYHAHNVEFDYLSAVWGNIDSAKSIFDELHSLENECCQFCDIIMTVSEEDAIRFQDLYCLPREKAVNISRGYDDENMVFTLPSKRIEGKDKLNALFISSAAPMAKEAADRIITAAEMLPSVFFHIAGSVGDQLIKDNLPSNVRIWGYLSDEEKYKLLETCDFALNPITDGSGMNIKMLEFFAAGLPVICTDFGARGVAYENGVNCVITEFDTLHKDIELFLALDLSKKDEIVINARRLFETHHTWRTCAIKAVELFQRFISIEMSANKSLPIRPIKKHVQDISHIQGNVYIYGSGNWGKLCLRVLTSNGIDPIAFLDRDSNKWGEIIQGVPVHDPKILCSSNNCTVIFALSNYIDAIKEMLLGGLSPIHVNIAMNGVDIFGLFDDEDIPIYIDNYKIRTALGLDG